MMRSILLGIGAGLAAALLFASPLSGTTLAYPLFILASLPIAIAGLAWSPLVAIIGVVSAALPIGALLSPTTAAVFVLVVGAPTVWMCRLAALSRQDEGGPTEWFPFGRILFQGSLVVAGGLIVSGLLIGLDQKALAEDISATLGEWVAQSPQPGAPPSPADVDYFVRFTLAALPFTMSALTVTMQVFNLWLAARIAAASGRLLRPLEPMWTTALPIEAAAVLAVAVGGCLIGGPIGAAAGAVTGAVGMAFALGGIAVVHALTVGSSSRLFVLVTLYVVLVVLGFPIFICLLLGLAETLFHLRARRPRGVPPIL